MILARKVKLKPTEDQAEVLLETLQQYKQAINLPLQFGFSNKRVSGVELHKNTYYTLRQQTQLPSQLVCSARCKATEILKSIKKKTKGKFNAKQPQSKKFAAIRYDRNSCTITDASVKLSTTQGRIEVPLVRYSFADADWSARSKTCELQYRKDTNEWYLIVFVEKSEPVVQGNSTLGIDRGCKHIAVTSDNQFFDSKHLRNVKGRYKYLRKRLQSKGTKSAKRKLRKLSRKENRFVRDVNHCISKKIVGMPFDIFVLEKLEIKKDKKLGKKFNSILAGWSWYQLESFLKYKAALAGKQVQYVDARYTSRKCSRCSHIERANRQGISFSCKSCGFNLHADLNAARNIEHNFHDSLATGLTVRAFSTVQTSQPLG